MTAAEDVEQIVAEAARLLRSSDARTTAGERRRRKRLAGIVADPVLRDLTFALTDEVLRVDDRRRAARRFSEIVATIGVPRSLSFIDRVALAVGARVARRLPWPVMPLVRARLVHESSGVVLSSDDPAFARHVARRKVEGCRVNVNVLGEAILSDAEADDRFDMIVEKIERPDVDYVSLKVSAICANLDVLAFDHSVERVASRLREIYLRAARSDPPTFVNLDMEEFRDLELTIAAMQRALDDDELRNVDAGIVLQSYLPDSNDAAERLVEWALQRRAAGGGRLKVRVVKGANLAMERVEAELHGWEQAPYATKHEVDANFKRLIERLLRPQLADAVRVGVASHNLFDIAWALMLCRDPSIRERVDFEMLEGMAPAQSRAVFAAARNLLLYAPVVRHDDLAASIAYLTRRLDENTSADNFLRALFRLEVGTPEWIEQRIRFESALAARKELATGTRRRQDRSMAPLHVDAMSPFANAADTDWTRSVNRDWIAGHLDAVAAAPSVPVAVDVTTIAQVDAIVERAKRAGDAWAATSFAERRALLHDVATVMESQRGATLSVMALEAGKTVAEGDPEVSEAIDFARWYAECTTSIERRVEAGATFRPAGVVVVASPWNFPYAIPAGGVLAALAAGNAVVLKPAPEARATARLLADQLWQAGVPRDLVQFVACPDDEVGSRLITHESVDVVVLTGSYETATMFLDWKPSLRLLAETSGKNAIVVTAAADEEAAIRDIVRSAFGHAGQKCSAASLAIVEAPVYDDPRFRSRLAAAVESVRVGDAADLATMMGPLIGSPGVALDRALNTLDDGESWLVEPRSLDAEGRTWTPGVRWDVRPGSWFHQTECFGPVLGVMRATDLDDAIRIQNDVVYGLTGGIQSLDDSEVDHWLDQVQVGNAYVNRHITGAIVRRQPFGGWKRSSVGCGAKAGGPWFVDTLGTWTLGSRAGDDITQFEATWQEEFVGERDASGLACERNVLRYHPLDRVGLVIGRDSEGAAVAVVREAARVAGVEVVELPLDATVALPAGVERIRVVGTIDDDLRRAIRAAGADLDETPPIALAELELRRWVREQAISWTRHRHGRLLD